MEIWNGGASRTRTNACRICNPRHYQLCYSSKNYDIFCVFFIKKSGRRTRDSNPRGFHLAGFQNWYNRPTLSILYNLMVRMVRIELTLQKPERDFKSRASTYSATLAQNLRTILSFHLNWTGIIVAFFLFVKSFLKNLKILIFIYLMKLKMNICIITNIYFYNF